ncbi:MAG TPA: hypothetical protein VK213_10480 [Bacteroidales bacterium]|nr:hypothetical protein [Bacteroidales bacterium]
MKTRALFLVFTIMIISYTNASAQLGGVVRRAVNRQVNREVDSLLDKKVQEEQDKNRAEKAEAERARAAAAEKEAPAQAEVADASDDDDNDNNAGSQSSSSNQGAGMDFSGLFGNKVTLKYKDDYQFTSRLYMVSETYDKDDVMKIDMYMFYSNNSPSIGMETQTITDEENTTSVQAKMVMDGDNKVFIMLTDVNGMKMGMISEVTDQNTNVIGPDGKPVKKYTPPTFTKTGNTKVIAGYKCDEYSYKSEDKTSGKVWFTKEADLQIDKRGWNNSNMSYYYGSNQFNDGVILATESYDEKGKLQTKSETKEINKNFPHSISTAGYTLRQMNVNQKK